MTFGERVKSLRQDLGLSQGVFGTRGFISTPGWIKIENGQRQASEQLVERLTRWLVADKHLRSGAASTLKEELLTLKYLGSRSPFLREMAKAHAKTLSNSASLLATPKSAPRAAAKPARKVATKTTKKR